MWRDAVLALLALKVLLLPEMETMALVCIMLTFYMVVHLFMARSSLLSLPIFTVCLVICGSAAAYLHHTESLTSSIGYTLFAVVLVAFRLDTYAHWRRSRNTRRKLMISTWHTTAEVL